MGLGLKDLDPAMRCLELPSLVVSEMATEKLPHEVQPPVAGPLCLRLLLSPVPAPCGQWRQCRPATEMWTHAMQENLHRLSLEQVEPLSVRCRPCQSVPGRPQKQFLAIGLCVEMHPAAV